MATRKQLEQKFHRSVAQFLDTVLQAPVEWTTIGHGGGGRVRGAILKSMGVKPGWPDVMISAPIETGRARLSLMVGLELKSQDGVLSHHQKAVHAALEKSGWHLFVCRDLDDVISALAEAGVPHRRASSYSSGGFILKGAVNV